jgi:hypothetical protein
MKVKLKINNKPGRAIKQRINLKIRLKEDAA